jgi:shikimate kinase
MTKKRPIIVLVGLMGAGKSRVGLELARQAKMPFIDADQAIEEAAGMSIPDIFAIYGEKSFRDVERKIMLRLLSGEPVVLASGGGDFIQKDIREAIKKNAVSIWLRAELDTLVERTGRRPEKRPLLQGVDRARKLQALMEVRHETYAEADLSLVTDDQTPAAMARRICAELQKLGYDIGTKGK